MVFDSVAFKNVISTGLVLDAKGNKMSKHVGNVTNPFEMIDKYGADPVRFYMMTNSEPWDNLKFDPNGVDETRRKFFGTLYNTYSFFALYANVDGFDAKTPQVELAKRPEIDRWILSSLNTLVIGVDRELSSYDPTRAGRLIDAFVNDDLSNWYVRLNRKRFWGKEMSEDKLSAYQTLYTCLMTVAKLLAPFAPFYADELYHDLGGELESVHLDKYPVADASAIDHDLEERMAIAQKITSMVLALRRKVNIKVRQPLQQIMIPAVDATQKAHIEAVADLLRNEVNVKEVNFIEGQGILVKKVKCNFRVMGKKFGKLMKGVAAQMSAGISTEYHYQEHTAFWTHAKGITTNDFGYDNIGATSSRPYGGTGSTYDDMSLASVMANASYTLYNKYKLTLTMRGDGSSMVGDDHTWGFFPSVSAEWDVKKEKFLRSFDGISTLKLRTGYGRSGNLGGITAYTTMENVQQTGIVPVNNTPTVTLGTIRNNNPDLKWETKSTFNIGGEIGLWHNRLMLTAEYYYSKTSDMLYSYDVPVPPFAYDKLLANIGSMSNQGLEIGFSIAPVQTKDIDLNVSMNLSFQKNKLLSLSGNYNGMNMSAPNITAIGSIDGAGQNGGDNNHVLYQIVGQPLGVFYLPHCTGLYKDEQGTMKYKIEDLDKNGTIDFGDGGDRRICGQATPKATLGSNISLRYKDFYISLQMNGAFGHKIFNGTALAYNNMSSFPTYNVLKGAPEKNIVDQNVSDYWLESGDYLNFEYLTIGYNIPVKSRIVRSLRVSCSVNNLATITSYSGLTPMINSYVVNSSMGIDDKRCYPTYRTYSVGVSVQF